MENMHAEVRLLGIKHSELLDSLAFTSKPIDETIPSFSMNIRLDEIPIHKFSIFPFQLSFNWKFICFSLVLLKESTQFGISQCAFTSFKPPSVSHKDMQVLYGVQPKTFTYFQGHSFQQQHTNGRLKNLLLKFLPV